MCYAGWFIYYAKGCVLMYGESKKLSIDNNIFLQYCLIILGMILSTLGINLYLAPAKLLSGGVAGICVILYKLFGINQGISSFLMNIPIFIIARKFCQYVTIFSSTGANTRYC